MGREVRGWEEASTPLHEERLDAVVERLVAIGAATVVDLGCGSGALLRRLIAVPRVRRIVGVDSSARALATARLLLGSEVESPDGSPDGSPEARVTLRQGSITALHAVRELAGFDAAVMVEALEHVEPGELSRVEYGVFGCMRPGLVIVTTPNHEYNELHGLEPGEYRHADHRFEWDRRRFRRWASGVAERNGYDVAFEGIGPANAWYGSSTQMAVFERIRAEAPPAAPSAAPPADYGKKPRS